MTDKDIESNIFSVNQGYRYITQDKKHPDLFL